MGEVTKSVMGRFGQGVLTITIPGTLTPGPKPYDPPVVTGEVVHALDVTVKGVDQRFVDNTTVMSTDLEITAPPFGAEASASHEFALDGKKVEVVRQTRIPSVGPAVAWKWIVRK